METVLSQVMPLMPLAPGANSSTSTSRGTYQLPRRVRHWTHVRLNGADAAAGGGGESSTGPAPLPLLDAIKQHPQPGDFTPPPGFVLRPSMNSMNSIDDSIGFDNEADVTAAIKSHVCSNVLQRAADWSGLAPAGTRPLWRMEKATSILINSLAFKRRTMVASPAVGGGMVEQQQQQQQQQEQQLRRRTGDNGGASSGAGHAASSSNSSGGSYRLDHVLVLQEISGGPGKRTPVIAIEVKHIPVLTQGACEPECFRPISLVDAFNDPNHSLHQRAEHIIGQVYTYLVTLGLRHGAITCWNATWLVCLDHEDQGVMHVSRAFLASDTAPTVLRALSWLQLDALRFVTSALEQQQQLQQQQSAPGAAPGGSEGKDGSRSSGSGAGGAAGGGDRRGAQHKRRKAQQQPQQRQQQQPADAMGAGGGGVDSGSGKAGRSGQAGEALLSVLSSDSCAAELQRAPLADAPVGDTISVVSVSPSTSSTSSRSRSPQPVEGLPQLPPPGQQERQQLQQEEQEEQAAGAEEKPLQFLQQLGHGRDGMVFRCMYDGRPAVIKVYSWERHQVKAAAREKAVYQALAALQGSVVPKVVVTGRLGGDLRALSCLVMEPVEGGARPLSDCGYRRPFPEHVQAAAQQALSRAHAEGFQADRGGFLHGDVRLANILLVGGCGGIGGGGGEAEAEAVQQAQEGVSVAHKVQAEEQVRCVLLDFGSSRLDGSAEEQAAELAKLRRLSVLTCAAEHLKAAGKQAPPHMRELGEAGAEAGGHARQDAALAAESQHMHGKGVPSFGSQAPEDVIRKRGSWKPFYEAVGVAFVQYCVAKGICVLCHVLKRKAKAVKEVKSGYKLCGSCQASLKCAGGFVFRRQAAHGGAREGLVIGTVKELADLAKGEKAAKGVKAAGGPSDPIMVDDSDSDVEIVG